MSVVDATAKSEILQIADDVFITGMQVSLGVGIALLLVTLIAAVLRFPAESDIGTESASADRPSPSGQA